jgi:hypothetical protein
MAIHGKLLEIEISFLFRTLFSRFNRIFSFLHGRIVTIIMAVNMMSIEGKSRDKYKPLPSVISLSPEMLKIA